MIILTLLIVFVYVFGHFSIVFMGVNLLFILLLVRIFNFLSLRVVQDNLHHVVFYSISILARVKFMLLVCARDSLPSQVSNGSLIFLRGITREHHMLLLLFSRCSWRLIPPNCWSTIHLDNRRCVFFNLLKMLSPILLC